MSNANQAVLVPFHGDAIEAIQDGAGQVWVSIRRGCENLGVSFETQLKKLKGKPWATMVMMTIVAEDGKRREVACLNLKAVPIWLAGIESRKVAEHLRAKLERYQVEAADVLADHFFGGKGDSDAHARIDRLEEKFEEKFKQLAAAVTGLAGVVGSLVESVKAMAAASNQPAIGRQGQRFSVADRCRFMGWVDTSPKQRARIRQRANTMLGKIGDVPDVSEGNTEANPGTHLYSGYQLIVLDNAISEIRLADERKDREGSPHLFNRVASFN